MRKRKRLNISGRQCIFTAEANPKRRSCVRVELEEAMSLKAQAIASLFTCTCMLGATTLPANSIGTVITTGEVQIDGSTIRSNSTLFNGRVAQTSASRSDLRLSDGSQVVLNPSSRMTFYRDHVVLNQGQTMQRSAGKHAVIANGLKVSPEPPNGGRHT